MPKNPYVVPGNYKMTIFSVPMPTGQVPGYATNCTYLAGAAPANASEIMLLSAWPVRPVADEELNFWPPTGPNADKKII